MAQVKAFSIIAVSLSVFTSSVSFSAEEAEAVRILPQSSLVGTMMTSPEARVDGDPDQWKTRRDLLLDQVDRFEKAMAGLEEKIKEERRGFKPSWQPQEPGEGNTVFHGADSRNAVIGAFQTAAKELSKVQDMRAKLFDFIKQSHAGVIRLQPDLDKISIFDLSGGAVRSGQTLGALIRGLVKPDGNPYRVVESKGSDSVDFLSSDLDVKKVTPEHTTKLLAYLKGEREKMVSAPDGKARTLRGATGELVAALIQTERDGVVVRLNESPILSALAKSDQSLSETDRKFGEAFLALKDNARRSKASFRGGMVPFVLSAAATIASGVAIAGETVPDGRAVKALDSKDSGDSGAAGSGASDKAWVRGAQSQQGGGGRQTRR